MHTIMNIAEKKEDFHYESVSVCSWMENRQLMMLLPLFQCDWCIRRDDGDSEMFAH